MLRQRKGSSIDHWYWSSIQPFVAAFFLCIKKKKKNFRLDEINNVSIYEDSIFFS